METKNQKAAQLEQVQQDIVGALARVEARRLLKAGRAAAARVA